MYQLEKWNFGIFLFSEGFQFKECGAVLPAFPPVVVPPGAGRQSDACAAEAAGHVVAELEGVLADEFRIEFVEALVEEDAAAGEVFPLALLVGVLALLQWQHFVDGANDFHFFLFFVDDCVPKRLFWPKVSLSGCKSKAPRVKEQKKKNVNAA